MEKEIGKIVNLEDGKAVVQLTAGSQCDHCGAKTICSSLSSAIRQITVPSPEDVKIGDLVELVYKPSTRIASSLIVFIMPVLFMIAGYFVAVAIVQKSEGMGIIGSLFGIAAGIFLVWVFNRVLADKKDFSPYIKKITV